MGFHDALLRLSAVELAQMYRQRDLSPVEVIRAVLARSVQRQADLNAFAYLDEAGALAAARAAEQRFHTGEPLGGCP
jgi:aspartyl-tRNA(Asn)/glutamyl-tRNA(Gln) amidotransferase subunit A